MSGFFLVSIAAYEKSVGAFVAGVESNFFALRSHRSTIPGARSTAGDKIGRRCSSKRSKIESLSFDIHPSSVLVAGIRFE